MKICWDNLEDIYITKNGNFRHKTRGTLYEKDKCIVCGESFLGKKKDKTCCRKCSYVVTSKSHIGSKRSKETRKKISDKAKERKPYTKHTIESVKFHFEKEGYKLLSTEYKNNKSSLKVQCPKGHIWITSYFSFQQGNRCLECSGKKKNEYDYVKEIINDEGYKIISKNYKNAFAKIEIQCPKGHVFRMKFNNFQQGQRCPECNKHLVVSKGEKEVYRYVTSVLDKEIIENDRSQIVNPLTRRYLELDIWIPSLNKAIEYNGEYWHERRNNKNDEIKNKLCRENNIDLMVINEGDWKSNKNKIKNDIKEWIYESEKS